MTHKLVIVKKRDPERDPGVTFFLLFFRSLRLCSARRILKSDWVNLTFAALRLTFIRGHEGFLKFHADRVIIGLPCGQGQLSRIWKVQRDWLSVGKECCPLLSRRLWGGTILLHFIWNTVKTPCATTSHKRPLIQSTKIFPVKAL